MLHLSDIDIELYLDQFVPFPFNTNVYFILSARLGAITQRAEISLVEKPKKEPSTASSSAAAGKGKKQARIKDLSPRVKRDEKLEALLQQCLDDAYNVLGYVPEPPAQTGK